MQQRLRRAERYRKEANRFAELAKTTTDPNFLINLYRQTAVRYVLMAEDLEREPEPRHDGDRFSKSLRDLADVFIRAS
jgi:hypothetical protein